MKLQLKQAVKRYRPWRSLREIPWTLFAVAWFILCTFLMSLTNAYLDRHNPYILPPPGERIRLPDPLLDSLYPGYVSDNVPKDLPDTLVHFAPAIMLLRVLLGGYDSFRILRRLGYLVGTGYLWRIIFVVMTVLPNSNVNCNVETTTLLHDAVLVMLQVKKTCGDVVFSGHTIMFMSASLVWIENPSKLLRPYPLLRHLLNFILVIYSFGGILSLVASAYHYTVDCAISVLIMLFMWKFYHYVVTKPHLDYTYISKFLRLVDGPRQLRTPSLPMQERQLSHEPSPYSTRFD